MSGNHLLLLRHRITGPLVAAAYLAAVAGCGHQGTSAKEATESTAPLQPSASLVSAEDDSSRSTAQTRPPKQRRPEPSPPPLVHDGQTFQSTVRPFFTANCVGCHGEETAEAELRLDTLAADFVNRPASDHWVEVLDRLNLGEMPPEDEPRPDAETLARVVKWITSELQHAQAHAQSTGGRVLLRRLTRLEYANTVRDLLKVEFVAGEGPLEQLPPDGAMAGFDRVSKALLLDPSLMEAYLNVAQQVADRAIVFRPPLVPQRTLRFEFERTPNSAMAYLLHDRHAELDGDFLVLMDGAARTFAKLRHPYNDKEIPITGKYRIRVRAAADPGGRGEPIYMDVNYGAEGRQARFRIEAAKDAPKVYEFEKTFDAFTPGEFQVGIVNGTRFGQGNAEWYQRNNELTRLAEQGNAVEATRIKARMRAEGAYDHHVRGSYLPDVLHLDDLPKLYLDWIEVVGPLQGEYPPPSMATIFGDGPSATRFADPQSTHEQLLQETRAIFARMLPRAFRRPVKDAEVQALVDLVEDELQAGADPEAAIKTGLVAMLCAPDFLFLFEPAQERETSRRLNDHELACRLSYFLWSTMPDEELRRLAGEGKLSSPEVLAAQVDRLLADPKIEGFVQGFARQWLKVDEFGRFTPDEQIYPDYYATDMVGIERDVEEEPLAFFREVLRRDESVVNFLDSDWLLLNERLAKLYEIPGVEGPRLRRVALARDDNQPAGRQRGGLLGMAGVHLWGADGNRTKPVERGKYILTVLFNDPSPPPPPNAGEVEPNIRGEKLTVRERLARHREQTTCNNCHRRIDPYGLAMENFNVIGRWRERMDGEKPLRHWGDDRPAIDASGTLPNGRRFANFSEFKQAILEQQDRFFRALAEKLFTYALGRTVEPGDRGAIDSIVTRLQSDDSSLRTMLKQIAASEPFQTK